MITENMTVQWGDIEQGTSPEGLKYITYNERATKTRQGDDVKDVKNSIRVFEDVENPQFCPVATF